MPLVPLPAPPDLSSPPATTVATTPFDHRWFFRYRGNAIMMCAAGVMGVRPQNWIDREMSLTRRDFKSDRTFITGATIALLIATAGLTGCQTGDVMNGGYIFDQQSLDLVPVGSSREQVLLSLGTPSTTATFDGEVFYYISQKRTRAVAFMKPHLVDQSILAIYFDKDGVVRQRANYTLKDGKPFDMISRTTPTGGRDMTFLQQVLMGSGTGATGAKNLLNTINPGQ
jgi:outer membrane protein assembly factor BamE (lipoprotein component of BamABCDE complex)